MTEPYYQVADSRMRDSSSKGSGVPKPRMKPKEGKAYVLVNSATLYHHLYMTAWQLETLADNLQYSEGYLFEEVAWIRQDVAKYKAKANALLGLSPLEWHSAYKGVTCEIN